MEPSPTGRNTRPLGKQAGQSQPAISWIERVATRKTLVLIFGLSLFLLVLAVAGGWYLFNLRQKNVDGLHPDLSITPPASLSELAAQYPQLAPILGDAELDSAYKDFMLAYEQGGPDAALELAHQRGLVNDNDELRITLELDTEDNTTLIAQLEAQGIKVTAASGNLIDVAVPLQMIEQLAQSGDLGALFANISELEHVKRVRLPRPNIQELDILPSSVSRSRNFPFSRSWLSLLYSAFRLPSTVPRVPYSVSRSGDVVIESLEMLNVPAWHAAGFTGQGIKIGILDMGFNTYKSFLGGELPENVTVRSFIAGAEIDNTSTEHGAACAEIIHDIAPDAELFFAAYETDVEQFQAIDWLVSQGVNIISHSAGSIYGPMDGTGPQASKVDEVVAGGILWVNSAGNMGEAHYRGTFVDKDGDGFHEFKPGDELLGFIPDGRVAVALNWDAWVTGDQDYDLYIMNENKDIVVSSKNVQDGAGDEAAEFISYFFVDNGPYYFAFYARRYTRPAVFDLYVYNAAKMEYTNAEYSITTPADSASSITVGATFWSDDALEDYSSQGPSHDGRTKPDISAPAGVSSAVYGEEFYGTSASAPHVAAAAALVWQAHPEFSVQQVSQYLKDQARDLGPAGMDSQFGYGRLQLGDAVGVGVPPPTVEVPTVEAPTVEAPVDTEPPPEDTETPEVEPTPEYDLVLSQQDLLLISLGFVGCVALPGAIGVGGIVLVAVIWSRSRSRRRMRQPVRPAARPTPGMVQAGQPPQQFPAAQAQQPPPAANVGNYLPTMLAGDVNSPAGETRCSRCGSPHRAGARFCNVCGNDLASASPEAARTVYCNHCGMALRPTSKFCPRCGQLRAPKNSG